MTCEGCEFSVGYYPLTSPPFLHAVAGFVPAGGPGYWPDGQCQPKEAGGCLAVGCVPNGHVTLVNNWLGGPLRIHHRTYVGDAWADYVLEHFGEGMLVEVPGLQLACGSDAHVVAEVWNGDTKVGEVRLACSPCQDWL